MATTINFKTGSSRTLSQAPRSVNNPFSIPPQLGAISMIEKTTPNDCAQSGNAVYKKMVRTRPDIYKYQCPEVNDRKTIRINRPVSCFWQEIIHQTQVLGLSERKQRHYVRTTIAPMHPAHRQTSYNFSCMIRQFKRTYNMQHGNRNPCSDIKPDRHIKMFFPSFKNCAKHVYSKNDPNQCNGNIYWPFQFGIFCTSCKTQWNVMAAATIIAASPRNVSSSVYH